jgi:hypothetical protein
LIQDHPCGSARHERPVGKSGQDRRRLLLVTTAARSKTRCAVPDTIVRSSIRPLASASQQIRLVFRLFGLELRQRGGNRVMLVALSLPGGRSL